MSRLQLAQDEILLIFQLLLSYHNALGLTCCRQSAGSHEDGVNVQTRGSTLQECVPALLCTRRG